MNLVIIGDKAGITVSDIVKKSFDYVSMTLYKDTNIFMQEATLRNISIHRIILLQDGIDDLSDADVHNFTDFIGDCYPSVRIITISKDNDTAMFLGGELMSSNHVHLLTTTITSKTIVDIVSCDVEELKTRYKRMIYKKIIAGTPNEGTEIIDGVDEDFNTDIETQPEKKSGVIGVVSKIFSKSNKKNKVKTSKTSMKKGNVIPIGHSQGKIVENFTEKEPTIFDEVPVENEKEDNTQSLDENQQLDDDNIDISVFDKEESDIGLGIPSVIGSENSGVGQQVNEEDINLEIEDLNSEIFEEKSEKVNDDFLEYNVGGNEELDIISEEDLSELSIFTKGSLDINGEEIEIGNDLEEIKPVYKIPSNTNIENLKKSMEETEIESISDFKVSKPKVKEDFEEVIDDIPLDFGKDIATIMRDYEEQTIKTNVKIVEKVIKIPVKEPNGFRNKNGVRLILVTGDRRTGVTKLSMNLANYYAKEEKTLLVDFDRYRKGVVSYMGVEEIINEPSHIQNGLNHVKNEKMLSNVVYLYSKGGFYTLQSMYGEEIDDEQITLAQKALSMQKEYTTVIIDCPIENLYLMTNLLYTSNILICIEDNRVGIINSVINLNSSVEEEFMPHLYNNSAFVVCRGSNIEKFKAEMAYVESIFAMDESPYNWGSLEIIGTIKGTKKLAEGMGV